MCQHQPRCPEWQASDHSAARIVADQPGQGWSLLCNGVILFDDGGELLPDRRAAGSRPSVPRYHLPSSASRARLAPSRARLAGQAT